MGRQRLPCAQTELQPKVGCMAHLLFINGSIRGASGNTATLLAYARTRLAAVHTTTVMHLVDEAMDLAALYAQIARADGFILATGTYWNSHSSALQRFVEYVTPLEGTEAFLGKPVAALVTMDSVGGIEVAQRLLGAFNLLGCIVPAFASLVLSRLSMQPASKALGDDIWRPADLQCTLDNLVAMATSPRAPSTSWPVYRAEPPRGIFAPQGRMLVDDAPWPQAWWPKAG